MKPGLRRALWRSLRAAVTGRSLSSAAGVMAAIGLGTPPSIGCTTHQCDASTSDYYGGHMVGPDLFVTNDPDQPWLSYPGNVTITVWMPPEVAGREWENPPSGDLGTESTPNGGAAFKPGDTFTEASGQLAYYGLINTRLQTTDAGTFGGSFQVTNATCSKYFARFSFQLVPRASDSDAGAGRDDGDSPADASVANAGDSPADASVANAGDSPADASVANAGD